MIKSVWAVDDIVRVKRDDINHWSKTDTTRNTIWKNGTVNIFGAKNEVVAFQLILAADSQGVTGVDVKLPVLTNGSSTIINTSNDPLQYVGRNIELFVEHYLNITTVQSTILPRGQGGDISAGSEPNSSVYLGWIPDALVPIEAANKTYDNGQGGAPFTIGANQVQGIWVDIYIPKTATPGNFTGTINVYQNGTIYCTIPINLTVYNFTLPDQTHFKTIFFGSFGNFAAHGEQLGQYTTSYLTLMKRYQQMMHRHRQNFSYAFNYDNFVQYYGKYFSGTGYTAAEGYDGPGVNTGDNMYPIGMYDQPDDGYKSSFSPVTEAGWRTASDKWEGWFQANAPNTVRFKYSTDEPYDLGTSAIQQVCDRTQWIKNNPGVGGSLKVGVTCRMSTTPSLINAGMDIFIETGESYKWYGYHTNRFSSPSDPGIHVEEVRAKGRMVGSYNGYRPDYGMIPALDVPATEHRVSPWVFYKYNTDLFLLWETAYWAGPRFPGGNISSAQNPWKDPKAQGAGWIYSGEDVLFTGDSRGVKGPIASIRMKTFRRGLQDYEYLWLAKNTKSYDNSTIVNSIVPAAYDDNLSSPNYNTLDNTKLYPVWAEENYLFEGKRQQLANVLSAPMPVPPTPQPAPPPTPVILSPAIDTQPQPVSIPAGDTANFFVSASGTKPFSYTWKYIPSPKANSITVTGAISSSLAIKNASINQNNSSFYCVVSNAAGDALSNIAKLTVKPKIS